MSRPVVIRQSRPWRLTVVTSLSCVAGSLSVRCRFVPWFVGDGTARGLWSHPPHPTHPTPANPDGPVIGLERADGDSSHRAAEPEPRSTAAPPSGDRSRASGPPDSFLAVPLNKLVDYSSGRRPILVPASWSWMPRPESSVTSTGMTKQSSPVRIAAETRPTRSPRVEYTCSPAMR